jgi:hypothetical protein
VCGKSTRLSYLSKSKDTLFIENDSSESPPVKYYLSKSLKVFDFKYTEVSKVNAIGNIYLSIKRKIRSTNNFKLLILSKPDGTVFLILRFTDSKGPSTQT